MRQPALSCNGIPCMEGDVGFKSMIESRNIANALLLVCLVSGCSTGRIADLRDCGRLSVGYGLGLEATAKIGCLMHPSIGVIGSSTKRIGHENRHLPCIWQERQVVWPVLLAFAGGRAWGANRGSPPFLSYVRSCHGQGHGTCYFETVWFPCLCGDSDYHPFSFHELSDVEAGATLGIITIRAGINPLEIMDFLLGCIGLDMAKDDPQREKKPTTGRTVPPSANASSGQ